ncbi:MAG: alpha-mannosidase [Anaerolineales bacterium]|nr:alpha-mannosidase [Anaerolineales bacterium]
MYHDLRWTHEKLRQRLKLVASLIYRQIDPLPPFQYRKLDRPRVDALKAAEETNTSWLTIPWGTYWGERNANFLLQTSFQIQKDWRKEGPIALYLPIGAAGDFSHPEALVYLDGRPYATCDRHHQEIQLSAAFKDASPHELLLNGWTGLMGDDPQIKLLMRECALVKIDPGTRDFYTLAHNALGVAEQMNENEPVRAHLYNALDEAFKLLDTREPFGDRFYASVPLAHQKLQEGITQSGPPLDVEITAIGHAHIDVAWLWTLDQTRLKAGRTFHNVIRLMEQYPTFRFAQSQPQLYEYVRNDYPDLFKAIQKRVKEGQWEPIGGMWVEADCNLSGGEALVRQLILGRAFYQHHFGEHAESPVLWLPDIFGFPWSLPQLIKQAGLKYFFTIKLGWSEYNRLPYDSFWWQGLDGTRVLTHFSTTHKPDHVNVSTYNAEATPAEILHTWRNFLQKDLGPIGNPPPLLMSFGHGNGGGGPTTEMLENVRVMASFPATPRVKFDKVLNFYRKLEADVGDRLPTWNSELYLEYHRGTYTTQAMNKRLNRRSEFLLHDVEYLSSAASILEPSNDYPHEQLQQAWKLLCLNQFHDILPGTSIHEVYDEALKQYADVQEIGDRLRSASLSIICEHFDADLLIVNPSSFTRHDMAFWSSDAEVLPTILRPDNSAVGIQNVEGGWLLDAGESPPYGIVPLKHSTHPHSSETSNPNVRPLHVDPNTLENDFIRVELNADGDITRLYDKLNQRETIPPGGIANQFQAFEDRPRTPDAWEIDIYYDDRVWLAEVAESVEVVEKGPLRATIEVRRRIMESEIVQRISLTHNSPRVDFSTSIDWQERHILLKVAFPVDVLSPQATYEIQWGNIERPTHRNTSWDWARFETCAQKWVDLSDGGYGVSLLNDCKYGHDIHDNVIRLTLLRSPTYPDPQTDLGEHQFLYSLLPHAERWGERTAAEAYAINDPLIVWKTDRIRGAQSTADHTGIRSQEPWTPFHFSPTNIIVETIKQAEDREDLILRFYEYQRRQCKLELTTKFPLAAAWRTNLLEENEERLDVEDNRVQLVVKPYQIVTLRLTPQLPKKTRSDS